MIPEDVKTRRGEPVLVLTDNGEWVPGYIEHGDGVRTHVSVATEPAGARIVLYPAEVKSRLRSDPGGARPLRDARGIAAPPERRFPVLNQQNCRPEERVQMPRSVPWSFVEPFRDRAKWNHSQSLETLAERGGLAPEELWLCAHDKGIRDIGTITTQAAVEWLCDASGEPRP